MKYKPTIQPDDHIYSTLIELLSTLKEQLKLSWLPQPQETEGLPEKTRLLDRLQKMSDVIEPFELYNAMTGKNEAAKKFVDQYGGHRFTMLEDDTEAIDFCLFSFYFSILQEYMESVGGWESFIFKRNNDEILSKIYRKHIKFLLAKKITVNILIPLEGCVWQGDAYSEKGIQLNPQLKFRNLDPIEHEGRVSNYFDDGYGRDMYYNDSELLNSNMTFEIIAEININGMNVLEIENRIIEVYAEHFKQLNSFVNLMSLELEHNLLVVKDAYYVVEGFPFNMGATPVTRWQPMTLDQSFIIELCNVRKHWVEPEDMLEITSESLKGLEHTYLNVFADMKKDKSEPVKQLENAFLRRTRSLMDRYSKDGFLDAVIGIESLLNGNQGELSYRMALYAANILQGDPSFEGKTKWDIFEDFRKMYKKRSKNVHGGLEEGDPRGIKFLNRLLINIMHHEQIDFSKKGDKRASIASQIEDIYLFN
ncbi:hypothetical protein EXIGUO8H_230005 [Exiguobacterium sp. 8H]|uniref:HEPN domain-containing protein n=1 Tax=unclassified Exiguobacterium TaxID=2644629 RepID=UPI0012F3E082|nr:MULTISPECIES: HEPN domain-containing protein [unclassified Exiguobacterium]VXB81125.1 hypothetical protein EXIGUO8H_230005 [Exiguobacterium sp. 8H]VXB97234.1 hypothetical protein EXIGUO8A_390002 [Exiguobacterium sp. 8A]